MSKDEVVGETIDPNIIEIKSMLRGKKNQIEDFLPQIAKRFESINNRHTYLLEDFSKEEYGKMYKYVYGFSGVKSSKGFEVEKQLINFGYYIHGITERRPEPSQVMKKKLHKGENASEYYQSVLRRYIKKRKESEKKKGKEEIQLKYAAIIAVLFESLYPRIENPKRFRDLNTDTTKQEKMIKLVRDVSEQFTIYIPIISAFLYETFFSSKNREQFWIEILRIRNKEADVFTERFMEMMNIFITRIRQITRIMSLENNQVELILKDVDISGDDVYASYSTENDPTICLITKWSIEDLLEIPKEKKSDKFRSISLFIDEYLFKENTSWVEIVVSFADLEWKNIIHYLTK